MKNPECFLHWLLMFFSHSSGRTKYILKLRIYLVRQTIETASRLESKRRAVWIVPLLHLLQRIVSPSLAPSLPPSASVMLSLLCAAAHVHTPPLRTALFAQRRCEELFTQPLPLSSIQFQSRLQSRRQQTLFRHDFRPATGRPAFLKPHCALHSFYFIFWWYRPYLFYSWVNILGLV